MPLPGRKAPRRGIRRGAFPEQAKGGWREAKPLTDAGSAVEEVSIVVDLAGEDG